MPKPSILTAKQVKLVEDNMLLVRGVIRDCIHDPKKLGILKMEDLEQIGYEGLCKAAINYKEGGPGKFSTYAGRVIYNQICDALRYTTLRNNKETLSDMPLYDKKDLVERIEPSQISDVFTVLERVTAGAGRTIQIGTKALAMRAEGYNTNEIGIALDTAPGTIRMYISRARKFLVEVPELKDLAAAM